MVAEVKQTDNKNFYNPNVSGSAGISSGQRLALNAAARGTEARVLVIVWKDKTAYVFPWCVFGGTDRWEWADAVATKEFTGWKDWETWDIGGWR